MRGKKPKERDKYVLRMADGILVEVTREIYLEWYQSRRREKYQKERDKKHGMCSLEELRECRYFFKAEACMQNETEELALQNIRRESMQRMLKRLPIQDARLIALLYFQEITVKAAADLYGCSRKAIQNRRKRILKELFQMIQENSEWKMLRR